MIKKLIAIGDIHIKNSLDKQIEFKEVCVNLFEQIDMVTKGYSREEVRILLLGDIVHQKININNELLSTVTGFFRECINRYDTILIAGNHDMLENNKDRLDSLSPIVDAMSDHRLKYLKKSEVVNIENIDFYVYSLFESNEKPNYIESTNTKIGLFHGPVNGCRTELIELKHGYPVDIFDDCDTVLAADIHKQQELNIKNGKLIYSSSTMQQDFGESLEKHGFLFYDVITKDYDFIEVENPYNFITITINDINELK